MSLDQDKSNVPMKDVDTSKLAAMSERSKASCSAAANATSEAMYYFKKSSCFKHLRSKCSMKTFSDVTFCMMKYSFVSGATKHIVTLILLMLVACIGGPSLQSCLEQVL